VEVALYVADAVVIEGRRLRAFAREHGVSKSWVQELVARFKAGGYEAVHPRSKAPRCVANRISGELEDRVVRLRKELLDHGFNCGAHTIHYHLSLTDPAPPSISTIWRVLKRRCFVTPEPHKATQELLHPLRGAPAQRVPAIRHHLLRTQRRLKGRDLELPRRLLEGMRGEQGAIDHDVTRCRRDPLQRRRGLGTAGLASDRHSNSVAPSTPPPIATATPRWSRSCST
jgi:hypothetical protein